VSTTTGVRSRSRRVVLCTVFDTQDAFRVKSEVAQSVLLDPKPLDDMVLLYVVSKPLIWGTTQLREEYVLEDRRDVQSAIYLSSWLRDLGH
jgi:hypothetical protein